jgi:hypothetical protein
MTRPNRTLDDIAGELHLALRRGTADILTIGGLLAEAKEKIPHGGWLLWLKKEFSMSERSAQNYVKAAEYAAKNEMVADLKLSPSALFLISRYEQPEIADAVMKAAKEEYLGRDQAREIVSKTLVELTAANAARSFDGRTGGNMPCSKPRGGVSQRDDVVFKFTAVVDQLDRLTKSRQAERFAKIPIAPDVLARVGQLLTDLANLKAKHAAVDAGVDKVA